MIGKDYACENRNKEPTMPGKSPTERFILSSRPNSLILCQDEEIPRFWRDRVETAELTSRLG
jgi:hypothetical protein